MKEDSIIKNRTQKTYTTTINGGSTRSGKNHMLKDHVEVLRKYRREIKEIKSLTQREKKLINLDELLKWIIVRKENVEVQIKNLQQSKYSSKDSYKNVYTKESVLKLAEEVLQEHEQFIQLVQDAMKDSGVKL